MLAGIAIAPAFMAQVIEIDKSSSASTFSESAKHARRLMRLNRRLQKRLLGLVERAGLDKDILIFK